MAKLQLHLWRNRIVAERQRLRTAESPLTGDRDNKEHLTPLAVLSNRKPVRFSINPLFGAEADAESGNDLDAR